MRTFKKGSRDFFLFLGFVFSLGSGIVFLFRASIPVDSKQLSAQFTANLSVQLAELDAIASDVGAQWSKKGTLSIRKHGNVDFFSGIYQDIDLWTGHQFLPSARIILGDFTLRHIRTGAGDFLLRKWMLDQGRFLGAVIPLHIHYKIQNEYLEPTWNEDIFQGYQVDVLDVTSNVGEPVSIDDEITFRFLLPGDKVYSTADAMATVVFLALAIVIFFILLLRNLGPLRKRFPARYFIVLTGVIFLLRYLMITVRYPARFLEYDLFDPKFFASSDFNPSMGDMVINSLVVMLLCTVLFQNFYRFKYVRNLLRQQLSGRLLSVIAVLASLFGFLFPYVVIQTLFNNSAIPLNISESITVDSLRVFALASIILSWISAFMFLHVCIRLLASHWDAKRVIVALVLGGLFFALINIWTGQRFTSSLLIGLAYITVVIIFRFYRSLSRFQYTTFAYLFAVLFAFSLDGYFGIQHYNEERKTRDQFRFASTFLVDRDDFGEFLMSEAAERIAGDLFIQTRMSGPFLNKEAVRQKVRQVFIPGYLNRYNITIHLFSAAGEPLDEGSFGNFDAWFNNLRRQSSDTPYEGVYFFNRPDAESTRAYLVVIPVRRNELNAGYVAIELALKRIIPDNVYPELLVDNRFQQAYRAHDFSYAVFSDLEVQVQSGDFNYNSIGRELLDKETLFSSGLAAGGFRHIAVKDQSGRVVVVSVPLQQTMTRLADFSFFFIGGLGTILLCFVIVGMVDFLRHERLSMAARIQLVLNLSFFIPLIGVSVITLGLTTRSTQEQLNSEYLARTRNYVNEVNALFAERRASGRIDFDQNAVQLANIMGLDASIFTPAGRLQVSSQPLIFDNNLLAPYVNPLALKRIQSSERLFILSEQVGKLSYFAVYAALNSPEDGSLEGIASIPFFQSAYSLERMQIAVLANILNIFTAIFVVLLFISYWVSTWLTFPLRMITQKLGRTSLTNSNQPLEWQSEDEIGLMVKEYNQMLSTLSENKRELERVQRERAWREIAQQVAHEIKNPLTPMKLTLQKIDRIPENDPERLEKIRKAIDSLLSQVDILDGVASSFSTFAKMPEPVMKPIEVVGLLKKIVNLHGQTVPIEFSSEPESVIVTADEQLLGRIFSNIILNGIQAARDSVPVYLKVHVQVQGSLCRITLTDNGAGIDESFSDKVFLPYFSTKKSGSGLGLAIAKQGVEQMGGSIGFESKGGSGTTFFISLPVAATT